MKFREKVTVIKTEHKAIVIATKTEPYKSPINFSSKLPQENMDYLIMFKDSEGTFSGKPFNVKVNQIE